MEFLYSIKNQLGETLNIAYDVCTESPRNWDNLGVVCTPTNKRYGWLNENKNVELWQSKEEDHKKLSKDLTQMQLVELKNLLEDQEVACNFDSNNSLVIVGCIIKGNIVFMSNRNSRDNMIYTIKEDNDKFYLDITEIEDIYVGHTDWCTPDLTIDKVNIHFDVVFDTMETLEFEKNGLDKEEFIFDLVTYTKIGCKRYLELASNLLSII